MFLDAGDLDNLLKGFSIKLGVLSLRAHDCISLSLHPDQLEKACQQNGVNMNDFVGQKVSCFPRVDLVVTPELERAILARGIYGAEAVDRAGKGIGMGNTYYLTLQHGGRLIVKYQAILGSWTIGVLTSEQVDHFLDSVGKEIKAQLSNHDA